MQVSDAMPFSRLLSRRRCQSNGEAERSFCGAPFCNEKIYDSIYLILSFFFFLWAMITFLHSSRTLLITVWLSESRIWFKGLFICLPNTRNPCRVMNTSFFNVFSVWIIVGTEKSMIFL